MRAHHRRGAIRWPLFIRIAIGLLIGGPLGALIADFLPGDQLRVLFALFVLFVAAQMATRRSTKAHRTLPGAAGLMTAGTFIGMVSSLFGVGGGAMTVPYLTWCSVKVHEAVATAAAGGLPIALTGTITYIITGLTKSGLPPLSLGYINLPAFAGIVVASTLFAPLGAKIAHKLPEKTLRRVFAVFLLVVGVRMLIV